MSGRQLASRMGMTQPSLVGIERSEINGAVTVRTLEKAASALGCRFVYALVPLEDTLEGIVQRRARIVATQTIERVSHSMALESQEVSSRFTKAQIDELADQLVRRLPRSLWELPE